MVGYLWAEMILTGILVAGLTGNISVVAPSIFSSAKQAVNLVIELISVMVFWLGIMKLIERSGLIEWVKILLLPLARLLFPGIPRDHPAMSAILMNMSANRSVRAVHYSLRSGPWKRCRSQFAPKEPDEMCTFWP